MIKRDFLVSLCVFFLGISGITYAADTEVILDSSDSTSGFSVKDSGNQTIMRAGGDGNVGIGTSSPGAKLEVVGDIKVGNSSATCNATTEGSQRYNSTSKKMEFCDGTAWTEYGVSADAVSVGIISAYGGSSAPSGWLICDGSAVSRSTYADLFTSIGTVWGSGDGTTTFNLPDLRGRFLRGRDGGAGRDPNRNSRSASAFGGNTGDNVGSVQGDTFKSHYHSNGYAQGSNINAWGSNRPWDALTNTGSTGGNETRPKNAYVNYIIQY